MNTFLQQGTKSHSFTQCPINSTRFHHLHTGPQDTFNTCKYYKPYKTSLIYSSISYCTFVDNELSSIWWWTREPLANVHQSVLLDTGLVHFQRVLALEETGPRAIQPILVLDVRLLFGTLVSFFADFIIFILDIFHFIRRDNPFLNEFVSILVQS